jgi:hypothetical protein
VFTSLAGFDKHQDVDYSRRRPVLCLDPATVGMAKNKFGRWQLPVSDDSRARLREIRANR